MNVLGYAQKIGQALMVPVAVLPAAAVPVSYTHLLQPLMVRSPFRLKNS